ncbi:hypothetical protein ACQWTT_001144 [Acinetobacter baumannii]
MSDKVIYYTENNGTLAGHIIPYTFVDDWTSEEIESKLAKLRRQGYEGLKVGTYTEYEEAAKEASYKAYKAYEAHETDAEDFKEKFNILPPQNHIFTGDTESFRISEELNAGLYQFYIRISDKYFKIVAYAKANRDELIKLCYNAMQSAPDAP